MIRDLFPQFANSADGVLLPVAFEVTADDRPGAANPGKTMDIDGLFSGDRIIDRIQNGSERCSRRHAHVGNGKPQASDFGFCLFRRRGEVLGIVKQFPFFCEIHKRADARFQQGGQSRSGDRRVDLRWMFSGQEEAIEHPIGVWKWDVRSQGER